MAERAHFRIAGIPVRVEPVFFVIMGLLGLQLAEESLALVLIWIAVATVSILVHELGHALTLKAFGQPSHIVLQGFGGVTISTRRLDRLASRRHTPSWTSMSLNTKPPPCRCTMTPRAPAGT